MPFRKNTFVFLMLFASLGLGSRFAFSEEVSDVNAVVINRRDALECVIDVEALHKTGVWMWLIDNHLSTGRAVAMAGLKGCDYRIEDGRLYRYSGYFGESWRDLGECEVRVENGFQILSVPKTALLKPDSGIEWRLVFYPHNEESPVFFPLSGPGTLPGGPGVALSEGQRDAVFLDHFFDNSGMLSSWMNLPDFVSGGGLRSFKAPEVPNISNLHLRSSFNDPFPGTLWWPVSHSGESTEIMKEFQYGRKSMKGVRAVVMEAPKALSASQTRELFEARQEALHKSGILLFVRARQFDDIPAQADGALIDWSGDLMERIRALRKGDMVFYRPLWVVINRGFFDSQTEDKLVSWQTWLDLKARPVLHPSLVPSDLSHESVIDFVWYAVQIRDVIESGREQPVPLSPPYQALNHPRVIRWRQVDFDRYLEKTLAACEEAFRQLKPSGEVAKHP